MKRHKAWIGAAIGAATGIASSLIGNSKKKEAEKLNAIENNRQQTLQMAAALTNKYGNQDYIDDYYDRVTFKLGGKRKNKKTKCELGYEDRLNTNNVITVNSPVKGINTNELYDSAISGVGNIINTAITNPINNTISNTPIINGRPTVYKKPITVNDININSTPIERLQTLRCGGRKKVKH